MEEGEGPEGPSGVLAGGAGRAGPEGERAGERRLGASGSPSWIGPCRRREGVAPQTSRGASPRPEPLCLSFLGLVEVSHLQHPLLGVLRVGRVRRPWVPPVPDPGSFPISSVLNPEPTSSRRRLGGRLRPPSPLKPTSADLGAGPAALGKGPSPRGGPPALDCSSRGFNDPDVWTAVMGRVG